MKKIYFGGKFNLKKDKNLSLEEKLKKDYRANLLGNSKLMSYYQEKLMINEFYQYLGPFYCEQASLGDFTSTDCNIVLSKEYEAVKNCDIFVCVFNKSFSVGTIVELGWALNLNKEIIIIYKEEESHYQIKSEYWFAIADAIKRNSSIKIIKYKQESEIPKILKELLKI